MKPTSRLPSAPRYLGPLRVSRRPQPANPATRPSAQLLHDVVVGRSRRSFEYIWNIHTEGLDSKMAGWT